MYLRSGVLGKQHTLCCNVASEAGHTIHVDVYGPMEVPSIEGARYFLLVKDNCSHYRAFFKAEV